MSKAKADNIVSWPRERRADPRRPQQAGNAKADNIVSLKDFRRAQRMRLWQLPGYRDHTLRTQSEAPGWRRLAKDHEAARQRLNARLGNGQLPGYESKEFKEAYSDYFTACKAVMTYTDVKPRHLPDLIRIGAELIGATDPVHADRKLKTGKEGEPSLIDVLFWTLHMDARHAADVARRESKRRPCSRKRKKNTSARS